MEPLTTTMDSLEYDDNCLYCRYSQMTPTALKYGDKLERYFYKDINNLLNEEGIRRLLIEKGTELGDAEMIYDGYMCLEQMYEFNRRFSNCIEYCEEMIIKEMGDDQGRLYIDEVKHYYFIPETITKDQWVKLESMSLNQLYVEKCKIEKQMVHELRRWMIFDYAALVPYFEALKVKINIRHDEQRNKSWVDTEDEDD
jgi:hypothetical protein